MSKHVQTLKAGISSLQKSQEATCITLHYKLGDTESTEKFSPACSWATQCDLGFDQQQWQTPQTHAFQKSQIRGRDYLWFLSSRHFETCRISPWAARRSKGLELHCVFTTHLEGYNRGWRCVCIMWLAGYNQTKEPCPPRLSTKMPSCALLPRPPCQPSHTYVLAPGMPSSSVTLTTMQPLLLHPNKPPSTSLQCTNLQEWCRDPSHRWISHLFDSLFPLSASSYDQCWPDYRNWNSSYHALSTPSSYFPHNPVLASAPSCLPLTSSLLPHHPSALALVRFTIHGLHCHSNLRHGTVHHNNNFPMIIIHLQ